MKYINPKIESSYYKNNLGKVLYDEVLKSNAKEIVDMGILNGYSSVCLAMAAKQTGGHVYAYDIFEDYPYNNSKKEIVFKNLKKYDVLDVVTVKKLSIDEWIKLDQYFDLLHVDISNTGETIEKLHSAFCKYVPNKRRILFEGGSLERDTCEWMVKYNMKKINDACVPFKVIAERVFKGEDNLLYYPSISELGIE